MNLLADVNQLAQRRVLLPVLRHANDLIAHTDQREQQKAHGDANQPAHGGLLCLNENGIKEGGESQ